MFITNMFQSLSRHSSS